DSIANVHLHDLGSFALAGVADIHQGAGRAVASDALFGEPEIGERKSGIAQSEAERIERCHVVEQVAAAGRRLVVVDGGEVSGGPGDGHRKLAPGIEVAEKDVGNCVAGLLAKVPALEDRGYVLAEIVDRQGTAVE